ncbi:MAG: carboxy terminal-processing peptidase [Verrucomicrobiota bacterium]
MATKSTTLTLLAATLTASILLSPAASRAETDFGQVAMHVANMLERNHYGQRPFDDDVSERLLDRYLESLDYDKKFFTQQDVEGFKMRYGITLDDHLLMSNVQPAHTIYEVYEERVKDRVAKVKEMIEAADFNFEADETIELSRKDSEWPSDFTEADELWRKWVQNQLLREELLLISEKKGDLEKEAKEKAKEKGADPADLAAVDIASIKLPEEDRDEIRADLIKRWDRILTSLEDNDKEEVVNYFLTALSMAFDPHSDYFSHREMENFQISMKHSLTGIGAMLSMADGMAEIMGLVINGPAHKSKNLQVKDRIVAVAQGLEGEMVDIVDMQLPKVVELIRGTKGSVVRLKVLREGDPSKPDEVLIVRDEVELKDKLANAELIETIDADGSSQRLGWIYLYSFYADMTGGDTSTTTDVKRLLQRLMKENIDGLVLDLRGNGGGSLEEAIDLTGLFIPRGPVVQSKDWQGDIDSRDSTTKEPLWEGPLVVVTDKASASASEILAAALQDYGRAIIVGEKTFGKGTVQTIMPVKRRMPIWSDKERAGALKVTIQKFYRIAGGSTQLRGVTPDVILPSRNDALEIGEASLPNPLGYDEIPSQRYESTNIALPTDEELQRRTDNRIAEDVEFQYILEDIARLEQRFDENILSLSKAQRIAETKENEERADARNDERRDRFADIREAEDGLFTTYKITLDNVDETTLTLESEFSDEEASGMIYAENDDEDEESLEFPHGFDPVKRETLHILQDFIDLQNTAASQTVKVTESSSDKKPAPATVQ